MPNLLTTDFYVEQVPQEPKVKRYQHIREHFGQRMIVPFLIDPAYIFISYKNINFFYMIKYVIKIPPHHHV